MTPRKTAFIRFALALAIGIVGAALFYAAELPLPFMMGAVVACMVASLAGWPVAAPMSVRPPMSAVIGTLIGASFTPDILVNAVTWTGPMAGMLIYLFCCGAMSVAFFRYCVGFDIKTAYFAGMPGGLVDMVLIGEALGADAQKIAMAHTARVVCIVLLVPLLSRFLEGDSWNAVSRNTVWLRDVDASFYLWFLCTAVVGIAFGSLARLPAQFLMGPMIVSAVLHVSGLTNFTMPQELVIAAQIGLGVTIGCRFAGMKVQAVLGTFLAGFAATFVMLGAAGLFAWLIGALGGYNALNLFLAYAPGGLAEMGLVALALQLDTAMVMTHQVVRVFIVGLCGPLVFRVLDTLKPRIS